MQERLAQAMTGPLVPAPQWLADPRALETLLAAAEANGVRALIVERLLAAGSACGFGEHALHRLRERSLREAAVEVHRVRELARCIGRLAAAGVASVVFKGAATAHCVYPRSALRSRDDADVLIDFDQLDRADSALKALGYTRALTTDRALVMRQVLYRRRDANGILHNLDVHWAITNRQRALDGFSARALRARAVPMPAIGDGALAPDAIDALLIACLHIRAHHAHDVRLIWLDEIRRMIERLDADGRSHALERARTNAVGPDLLAGIARAASVFALDSSGLGPLPGEVAARSPRRIAVWMDDLRALDGLGARARYLAAHAFPSPGYMRSRHDAGDCPLAWLYLRRAARGVRHLLGP